VLLPDLSERALFIGVRAGRIVALSEVSPRPSAAGADSELLDFGTRPIVPAWVNGHTHLALLPLRGVTGRDERRGDVVKDVFFPFERQLSAEDVRAFTRLGAYEAALAGVGEVWDHYYFGTAVAAGLGDVGLTGVVAPTLQDLGGPGQDAFERGLAETRELCAPAWASRGISAALGPHATDTVSDALLGRAGGLAQALGLPVHLHLMQSHAEAAADRSGRRGHALDRLLEATAGQELVVAHGLFLDADDVARLVTRGAILAHCPLSQLQFGFLGPLGAWLARGGLWTLGTDCVASNDAADPQRELPLLAADAALRVSYSPERERLLTRRTQETERSVEALRREAVHSSRTLDHGTLLRAAWGMHLPGPPRGIQLGAFANLLVLDDLHPALEPLDDLPRALCYGSIAPALHQVLLRGRPFGAAGQLAADLTSRPAYRDQRDEARARRSALLRRAR
jgi:cytosine/adenosine deaminase-related metal-dependent hydrolase